MSRQHPEISENCLPLSGKYLKEDGKFIALEKNTRYKGVCDQFKVPRNTFGALNRQLDRLGNGKPAVLCDDCLGERPQVYPLQNRGPSEDVNWRSGSIVTNDRKPLVRSYVHAVFSVRLLIPLDGFSKAAAQIG